MATLDNSEVVRLLRDRITEVDAEAPHEGEDLVIALGDALRVLKAKKVRNMSSYTVDTDPETSGTYGINPEPEEADALIIILKAAVDILQNEYRGRLKRGEMGIAWKSGLEEESSVTAAKEYSRMIDSLQDELTQLVLIGSSGTAGTRIQ